MKRVLVLTILPVILLALEPVNLIKNHSFEKEGSEWIAYTGMWEFMENDSAQAKTQDSEAAFFGVFSASTNTSSPPGDATPLAIMRDSAVVIQGFSSDKPLQDLDSLYWVMKVVPPEVGFHRECYVFLSFLFNLGKSDWIWAVYTYYNPSLIPWENSDHRRTINFELSEDSSWIAVGKPFKGDWIGRGLDPQIVLDSVALVCLGADLPGWHGQKAYWDDIRLTGYADYDVGVKEILSGDSVWAGVYYKPIARIKSFGRQAADDFIAIAEIRQGSSLVWADTIPYTLPGDTEDTLEFDSFPVPTALNYTITVRTEMFAPGAIDESDEDDALSKPLYGTSVSEQPGTQAVTLEVQSFTANPRIGYTLPAGESGTISIYNSSGRKVESLEVQGSGEVRLSAQSSGVYFVRLEALNRKTFTRKLVVLR